MSTDQEGDPREASGPAEPGDPEEAWYFDLPQGAWERQEAKNRELRQNVRQNIADAPGGAKGPHGSRAAGWRLMKPGAALPQDAPEPRRFDYDPLFDPTPREFLDNPPLSSHAQERVSPPDAYEQELLRTPPAPRAVDHGASPAAGEEDILTGLRDWANRLKREAAVPGPAPAEPGAVQPPHHWAGRLEREAAVPGPEQADAAQPATPTHPSRPFALKPGALQPLKPPPPASEDAGSRWNEAFAARPADDAMLDSMRDWAERRRQEEEALRSGDLQSLPADLLAPFDWEEAEPEAAADAGSPEPPLRGNAAPAHIEPVQSGRVEPHVESAAGGPPPSLPPFVVPQAFAAETALPPHAMPAAKKHGFLAKLFGRREKTRGATPAESQRPEAPAAGAWLPDDDEPPAPAAMAWEPADQTPAPAWLTSAPDGRPAAAISSGWQPEEPWVPGLAAAAQFDMPVPARAEPDAPHPWDTGPEDLVRDADAPLPIREDFLTPAIRAEAPTRNNDVSAIRREGSPEPASDGAEVGPEQPGSAVDDPWADFLAAQERLGSPEVAPGSPFPLLSTDAHAEPTMSSEQPATWRSEWAEEAFMAEATPDREEADRFAAADPAPAHDPQPEHPGNGAPQAPSANVAGTAGSPERADDPNAAAQPAAPADDPDPWGAITAASGYDEHDDSQTAVRPFLRRRSEAHADQATPDVPDEAPQAPDPEPPQPFAWVPRSGSEAPSTPAWALPVAQPGDDVVLRAFEAHAAGGPGRSYEAGEDDRSYPEGPADDAGFEPLLGREGAEVMDEISPPPIEHPSFARLQGWAPQKSPSETGGPGWQPPALAFGGAPPPATDDWTADEAEGTPPWGGPPVDSEPQPLLPVAPLSYRRKTVVREVVETLLLALLVFLAVRASFQNFKVDGMSMYPTLHNGQFLIVDKITYSEVNVDKLSTFLPFIDAGSNPKQHVFHGPRRGDIVVLQDPRLDNQDLIKRVIGLPGDTIQIENGVVYVNDQKLIEPYIKTAWHYTGPKTLIPAGDYFVMGDNRDNSLDSRNAAVGLIKEDLIIGKAMLTYWPMSKFGTAPNEAPTLDPTSRPPSASVPAAPAESRVAAAP